MGEVVASFHATLYVNRLSQFCLGFRGNNDDPEFITEFIDKYIDREEAFNSVLLNKLTGVFEDLKWDFPVLNSKINKFFKFM